MEKYLIFTDIDGTLSSGHPSVIPNSSIKALHRAREKGHQIFLCTGRAYAAIGKELFDLPIDGLVLCCGAHIIHHQQLLTANPMPRHLLDPLIKKMIHYDIGFSLEGINKNFLYSDGYDLFCSIYASQFHDSPMKQKEILANKNMIPFEYIQESDYDSIIKISFYTNKVKEMQSILDSLDENLTGYFDHCFANIESGEIIQKTIDKASGIDQVINKLGYSLNQTMAIGDGNNDLSMVQHAHIGIAMGNACEDLKKVANYTTADILEDGFEKALQHYHII